MTKGPAMTKEEAIKSIETGIGVFESEFKRGINIIGTGDMGIGNTTASSAITSVITERPVQDVTGRGTGIDDQTLSKKIKVIKKAIRINRPNPKDAIDVLAKVGGFEIGGLAGVILAAAANRIPVVIDGFISGAAALIAYKLEPKVKDYMIAAHRSQELGHRAILEFIGLRPLLDLDLRLGEGTGAALAIGIAEASIKVLTQMATFQSASVSERIK
jgi:nicotinate-nucleotide--dimethylbenzimidazole phosphoribosyltransferase